MIIKPFAVLSAEDAEKLVVWFDSYHTWGPGEIAILQKFDVLDFWSDLRLAVRDKENQDPNN